VGSNPANPPGATAGSAGSVNNGYGAGFRATPPPTYTTNYYTPAPDPYGGYLTGAANVISSQGQLLNDVEQSGVVKEQARQARLDTRRQRFDEDLYERQNKPTAVDEDERNRLENLRKARNNPPLNEIWSGKALNSLLVAAQQMTSQQKAEAPIIPLYPDVLGNINVTSGATQGSVGMLRNGGKLRWPLALTKADYAADRKKMDQLAVMAAQQIQSGPVNSDTLQGMIDAENAIEKKLKSQVDVVPPSQYIEAKRFLREMDSTLDAVQDPNVANLATRRWAPQSNTVGDLVQSMTAQGLRFAPAVDGGQAAYNALHSAMVAYTPGPNPNRPWDPFAK
jgi:hypothetical protein